MSSTIKAYITLPSYMSFYFGYDCAIAAHYIYWFPSTTVIPFHFGKGTLETSAYDFNFIYEDAENKWLRALYLIRYYFDYLSWQDTVYIHIRVLLKTCWTCIIDD